jgi:hypothetical protein
MEGSGPVTSKRVIPHIHDLQLLEAVDDGERAGKLVIRKSKSRKRKQLSVTRRYDAGQKTAGKRNVGGDFRTQGRQSPSEFVKVQIE